MTQPSFQVDGLQIEPGSGQTLTITRQASNGALKFIDAVVTGGLTLSDLANLGQVTGVIIVGRAGTGAGYTTIQSAITAVPASASLTNPYVILVLPGVYAEALTIEKAGITILALGRVVLQPATAAAAVTVQDAVTTYPTSLTLQGLTIIQTNAGLACVNLVGGAGSTVGAEGIILVDCDLQPTGVGGYTVYADAVDYVVLRNCRADGAAATASMRINQCAGLSVTGGNLPAVQADYTTAGTIPSVTGSTYTLSGCATVGNVLSTLSGAGVLTIRSCPSVGTVTVNGNRTLWVTGSVVGNITLNGTTAATLKFSTHNTVAGAGTLWEAQTSGTKAFAGSAAETVTFDVARPDANYTVAMDQGILAVPYVSAKLATGFTVTFPAPAVATVYWTVTS